MSDAEKPQMTEEERKVQEEREKFEATLKNTLGGLPGGPTSDQIEGWKQKHGEVFCSGFSNEELFVWRAVTRGEFSELQMEAQQATEPVDMEARLVETCLLFASPEAKRTMGSKAGTYTTLHEQVLSRSNFMNPAVAQELVIKL